MTIGGPWLSRLERLDVVGSTNDVVAGWLAAGTTEVCAAVASEQTAGRGRSGRTWLAPRGGALLCSLGFRPTYLAPGRVWQLAGIVSLAMADAVEATAGVAAGAVRLKWPNDLVVADGDRAARKLGGVLGETVGVGTDDPRTVIGIGVNARWPRATFPADLAPEMTSVLELAGGAGAEAAAKVDAPTLRDAILDAFLERLGPLVTEIHSGRFPADAWRARQLTSGAVVRMERPDGNTETVLALDVDADSGALVVGSPSGDWPPRAVTVGEIRHLRLASEV